MLIKSAQFVTSAAQPAQFPAPDLPEVAFAGRSNVGKSSLINTLVNRKKLVLTSSTPGKTRLINFFRVNDAFMFVDLPGYGYAKVSHSERRSWRPMIERYLTDRESLKAVVVILDVRRTPGPEEVQLLKWLEQSDIPPVLVVTKADKLSKSARAKQVGLIAEAIGVDPEELLLFSSKTRHGWDALWKAILELTQAPPEDERA
ncbi:MAG: YihA family ribosome biogenesis GTP-binding protein [Desulfobacteraceae bacterium]|nr:MAG: YihA family ribosome biogenesis GTP-binding protein [Desulfobacteraceae bacterium]